MANNIFTHYTESRNQLCKNKKALQTTFIPDSLPHRTVQIDEIVSIIAAALNGDKPSNIMIFGKTGTGKTAVMNYIGNELKKADPEEKKCAMLYVNCEVIDTPYNIMYNIANQVAGTNNKIPYTGWSGDRVYEELKSYIDQQEKIFLIVLDEIDRLFAKAGEDIFYMFTIINEVLQKSKVSLIGISNNPKFIEFIDPKVRSRLGEERIIFPPYDASQLEDILNERALMVYEDDILEEGVIPYCAALSAQEMGDARRALDLLRIATDIAERNNDNKVTEAHVKSAKNRIELDTMAEIVKTLTMQSKTVLMCIIINEENNEEKITTGSVYSTYKKISSILGTQILTQRRITDFISELDMMGIIHVRVISFGKNGRTKEIKLSISKEIISMVKNDEFFKNLKSFRLCQQTTLI
jgi:archaeal cell division control protein 6